jgi:hypothetical protein
VAFCTSLIDSLLAEACMPDLELRRGTQDLKIGAKALQSGKPTLQETTTTLKGGKRTFGNRFQDLLNSLEVDRKNVTIDGRLKYNAPLISNDSKVDVSLARMKKSNTSEKKYQQEALSNEYEMVAYILTVQD